MLDFWVTCHTLVVAWKNTQTKTHASSRPVRKAQRKQSVSLSPAILCPAGGRGGSVTTRGEPARPPTPQPGHRPSSSGMWPFGSRPFSCPCAHLSLTPCPSESPEVPTGSRARLWGNNDGKTRLLPNVEDDPVDGSTRHEARCVHFGGHWGKPMAGGGEERTRKGAAHLDGESQEHACCLMPDTGPLAGTVWGGRGECRGPRRSHSAD